MLVDLFPHLTALLQNLEPDSRCPLKLIIVLSFLAYHLFSAVHCWEKSLSPEKQINQLILLKLIYPNFLNIATLWWLLSVPKLIWMLDFGCSLIICRIKLRNTEKIRPQVTKVPFHNRESQSSDYEHLEVSFCTHLLRNIPSAESLRLSSVVQETKDSNMISQKFICQILWQKRNFVVRKIDVGEVKFGLFIFRISMILS